MFYKLDQLYQCTNELGGGISCRTVLLIHTDKEEEITN